ncbi:hypothetical protein [Luteitalea sp.]|uniref:hypothetical protein n=1 Tax=Luteitalea sp. TaxID=2004800 RepID=UPI0025C2CCB2|nr:hypothetical protein [Luteitalea sp.]
MAIVAIFASAGLTSTALVQDAVPRRLVVDVDDPRPLSAAARQLERQLGLAVTYEDGSYVAPSDIVDVTEQVRRDGRTEPRVLVMRGGPFTFESALTVNGAPVGIRQVLDRLVATWNHSGMGGEFAVADVGGGLHVVPTARRGVTGEREPYTSPLSAPIDMPTGERTGLDIVTAIARLVSEQTGRTIWVGMMPTNLMLQKSATVEARNESGRSVLWRALQQLHPSLSWQLLCSVGEQADCALNIHAVPREIAPRP